MLLINISGPDRMGLPRGLLFTFGGCSFHHVPSTLNPVRMGFVRMG